MSSYFLKCLKSFKIIQTLLQTFFVISFLKKTSLGRPFHIDFKQILLRDVWQSACSLKSMKIINNFVIAMQRFPPIKREKKSGLGNIYKMFFNMKKWTVNKIEKLINWSSNLITKTPKVPPEKLNPHHNLFPPPKTWKFQSPTWDNSTQNTKTPPLGVHTMSELQYRGLHYRRPIEQMKSGLRVVSRNFKSGVKIQNEISNSGMPVFFRHAH